MQASFGIAVAIRQKATEADTLQTVGKRVQKEAANKLLGRDRQHSRSLPAPVVFPLKADFAVVQRQQALIANRDAMGISTQIFKYLLRTPERRLGIDDPVFFAQRIEVAAEHTSLAQRLLWAEEPEFAGIEEFLDGVEQASAEPGGKDANG